MSDVVKLILLAGIVCALVFVCWMLAMLRDGRRLRHETEEWRRGIARQEAMFKEDDDDIQPCYDFRKGRRGPVVKDGKFVEWDDDTKTALEIPVQK
jgi:hypothetical protein